MSFALAAMSVASVTGSRNPVDGWGAAVGGGALWWRPSGVIATPPGCVPTGIGVPAFLVATPIGVTVALPPLVTKAVLPSGVIATPPGAEPTGIGVADGLVGTSSGATVLLP